MSFSAMGGGVAKGPLRITSLPELQSPSLIVSWALDASRLGSDVVGYLKRKLGIQAFGEIEPQDFFPLGGVTVEGDILQFPESRFYASPRGNLVIFESTPPGSEWFSFLNTVLDTAEMLHVKELYGIGAMVSLGPHTTPRQILGTANLPELRESLKDFNLAGGFDFETPPGQRPTLNSFLLWAARRRNVPGINLWVPVPFYLTSVSDPRAVKAVLEFLNRRFDLQLDFSDIDADIKAQNERLARIREAVPDIDAAMKKLETSIALTEEESQKLVKDVEKFLKGNE